VVVIVGIFATLAIPQVTRRLRDRRVHETAQRVALVYQQARLRAMGQGGAVLVRYTPGGGNQGRLETREALVGTGTAACALVPATSCMQDWDVATTGRFRVVDTLELSTQPYLDNVFATATTAPTPAVATNYMDICFSPLGRAFARYANTSPLAPMIGVPRVDVYRGSNATTPVGLTRSVLVLPSGIARLSL
jgi:type II secretory pathway pseudopilin PulG